MKYKKFLFILAFIFLLIAVSGIFSPPKINYWVNIELPSQVSEVRNINLRIPVPMYRGYPIPYYKGTLIREISQSFQIAAKVKNATADIYYDKNFGPMLKIFIPKLSNNDNIIATNKLNLNFPADYNLPYLFTLGYFLVKPRKNFFLSATLESWYFNERKINFSTQFKATRNLTANYFVDFNGERIALNFGMRVEKKLFLGKIVVYEKTSKNGDLTPAIITSGGWKKATLYGFAKKSFF